MVFDRMYRLDRSFFTKTKDIFWKNRATERGLSSIFESNMQGTVMWQKETGRLFHNSRFDTPKTGGDCRKMNGAACLEKRMASYPLEENQFKLTNMACRPIAWGVFGSLRKTRLMRGSKPAVPRRTHKRVPANDNGLPCKIFRP